MREGVADLARHPLNDPIPAGATDAGLELGPNRPYGQSVNLSGRDKEANFLHPPRWVHATGGGDDCQQHAPIR